MCADANTTTAQPWNQMRAVNVRSRLGTSMRGPSCHGNGWGTTTNAGCASRRASVRRSRALRALVPHLFLTFSDLATRAQRQGANDKRLKKSLGEASMHQNLRSVATGIAVATRVSV